MLLFFNIKIKLYDLGNYMASFSQSAYFAFTNRLSTELTSKQKQALIISSLAIGIILTRIIIYHGCFSRNLSKFKPNTFLCDASFSMKEFDDPFFKPVLNQKSAVKIAKT